VLSADSPQLSSCFALDPLGNRTHFSEQVPVIAGLMPSTADTGLALQQLQDPSTDTNVDSLVAATTDAAQPVAEAGRRLPGVPPGPVQAGAGRRHQLMAVSSGPAGHARRERIAGQARGHFRMITTIASAAAAASAVTNSYRMPARSARRRLVRCVCRALPAMTSA